jgi:hypothetical protein
LTGRDQYRRRLSVEQIESGKNRRFASSNFVCVRGAGGYDFCHVASRKIMMFAVLPSVVAAGVWYFVMATIHERAAPPQYGFVEIGRGLVRPVRFLHE